VLCEACASKNETRFGVVGELSVPIHPNLPDHACHVERLRQAILAFVLLILQLVTGRRAP
jgi:hypothetical protein